MLTIFICLLEEEEKTGAESIIKSPRIHAETSSNNSLSKVETGPYYVYLNGYCFHHTSSL